MKKCDNSAVAQQWDILGLSREHISNGHTMHPEAQWFPRVGLGLFIHWGIASVHGKLDLSWGMMYGTGYDTGFSGKNKVTPNQYWALADGFKAEKFSPYQYLKAASDAGFDYAVFTTMHHDGYTLWPSKFSEFGVHTHLGGRDLVEEYVQACRKAGLKVGLYLSPCDWYFDRLYKDFNARKLTDQDRGCPLGLNHEPLETLPVMPDEHKERMQALLLGRVEELLTRYGRIDLLWFDGGEKDPELIKFVREIQPHIVVNSRKGPGDFNCTECRLPTEKFTGWFEMPHCWIESNVEGTFSESGTADIWGYLDNEEYRPTTWMLTQLARLRTWGGNLLINISPRPDGSLPDVVYQRFEETRQWMQHSGNAIRDITPGTYPKKSNAPVTIRDNIWYVFVHPGMADDIYLKLDRRPSSVRVLRTGKSIPCFTTEHGYMIRQDDIMARHTVEVLYILFR